MAGIQVGQGHGRRAVDHEIPLVPFVDLLLCCVMFLLVTAVWNRLAAIESSVDRPGDPQATTAYDGDPPLRIVLHADSIELSSEAGERVSFLRDVPMTALREALRGRDVGQEVDVIPDDGLAYAEVISVMDAVIGEGFVRVSIVD